MRERHFSDVPLYTVSAVAKAAGIPVRRVEGWVERRVVRPRARARGTGHRARFTLREAFAVAAVAAVQRHYLRKGLHLRPGQAVKTIRYNPQAWVEWFRHIHLGPLVRRRLRVGPQGSADRRR